MVSTFNLVIFFFVLLCFEFFVLNADIIAPGLLFSASFFLCSVCTWSLAKEWNFEAMHAETFNLVVIASVIFIGVEFVVRSSKTILANITLHIPYTKNTRISIKNNDTIYISDTVLIASLLLILVCIVWTLTYILNYVKAGDWNSIMRMYKDTYNLDASSFGVSRKILNQFNKIIIALIYVELFAFVYNRKKIVFTKKTSFLYIANFVFYMLFRLLLTGGRQSILNFVVAWLTCAYICSTYKKHGKERSKQRRRYVIYLLTMVAIIFPLFYFFGRFAGRKETEVLYATISYLSTGIFGLEQEVSKCYASAYWGQISFVDIFKLLRFLGVVPENVESVSFLPFFAHGNTVSLFGRWYWDFQWSGVLAMTVIVSLFFSVLYYWKIQRNKDGKKRNLSIIVYIYMVHSLYFAGYDDFTFNFPTLNTILILFCIYIIYYFICTKKLKIVFGKKFRKKNGVPIGENKVIK